MNSQTLNEFNGLPQYRMKELLFQCCGSTAWVNTLVQHVPFSSIEELKKTSDSIWQQCNENDWLEAFTHHPKIGDISSLEKKFATTKQWASNEQKGLNVAPLRILQELKSGNEAYEKKFGFIFIVCATGKSASEMLEMLNQRIVNNKDDELKIAMAEQNKITHIRLEKLFK